MMGTAIAAAHLRCGLPVVLYDSADAALQTATERIAHELRLQNVTLPPSLLACTGNLDEVIHCPVMIETITEKIKAKQKLYQKITAKTVIPTKAGIQTRHPCESRGLVSDVHVERLAPCLRRGDEKSRGDERVPFLFTNTSTLSITLLAEHLPVEWQRRFCGFHFFHPVRQRSLVEIVAGKHTDSATLESAQEHARRIDKRFIRVGDSPGFLVNRILNPYLSSALLLLEQKVDVGQIERAAVQFGMKMGPFRIMDEIGLDVVLHAGWVLHKAFPDRTPQSPILLRLIDEGKLGRKTGQGFMVYSRKASWEGEGVPDPQFASAEEKVSDVGIVRRLFVPMYEEAVRCYEEGIISDLSMADMASIEALGFPADKGGIVNWGRSI
jgi:3-hydroxyacyl-CoA dehydrogenase